MTASLHRRALMTTALVGLGGAYLFPLGSAFAQTAQRQPQLPVSETLIRSFVSSSKLVVDFSRKATEAEAKAKITKSEGDRIQQEANQAKEAVPKMERDLREIIQNLKSAGLWGHLDEHLRSNLSSAKASAAEKEQVLAFVKENGGTESLLERGLVKIAEAPREIDGQLALVKRKEAMFHLELISPAYALMKEIGEFFDKLAKAVSAVVGFFCLFWC